MAGNELCGHLRYFKGHLMWTALFPGLRIYVEGECSARQ